MKFALTRVAAAIGMVVVAGSAQAELTGASTLSIDNDAVTTYLPDTESWIVSSDGPLLDSFFTLASSSQVMQSVETQYGYLYNGADLTLSGAIQPNIATFSWYGYPGSFESLGSGVSILSASGDIATVNMSGWTMDWVSGQNISLGTQAWSAGYTSGIGNISCTAGSGCAVGSAYTLRYTATIPYNDPSGLGSVKYYLELHGTVGPVPIPEASTYSMMLAGLALVGAAARRRKQIRL